MKRLIASMLINFLQSVFLIVLLFRVNHKLADVGPDAPNPILIQAKEVQHPPNIEEQREIDTANKK